MSETKGGISSERAFVLGGLASAVVTLALGAFWLPVFVFGAGVIFSIALLSTDNVLQRRQANSNQGSLSRRLIGATIVAISYPCGVLVFTGVVSSLDWLGIGPRNFLGLCAAAIVSASSFYWALAIVTNASRKALLPLLLVALSSVLVSATAPVWGEKLIILRPHWFVSPSWVTLLVIGETGFAWVWGKSSKGFYDASAPEDG